MLSRPRSAKRTAGEVRVSLAGQLLPKLLHGLEGVAGRDRAGGPLAAGNDLDVALLEGAAADVDADREADQVGVLELDPGALVAVVVEDVEPGGAHRLVERVRRAPRGVVRRVQRDDL